MKIKNKMIKFLLEENKKLQQIIESSSKESLENKIFNNSWDTNFPGMCDSTNSPFIDKFNKENYISKKENTLESDSLNNSVLNEFVKTALESLKNEGEILNLYKIRVKHYSPKDSHESIEKFMLANNESSLYDKLCEFTNWNEKYSTRIVVDFDILLEKNNLKLGENLEFETQCIKDYIISLKGEINQDFTDYSDKYYGLTHYGWELVKKNISREEVTVLKNLNILT